MKTIARGHPVKDGNRGKGGKAEIDDLLRLQETNLVRLTSMCLSEHVDKGMGHKDAFSAHVGVCKSGKPGK